MKAADPYRKSACMLLGALIFYSIFVVVHQGDFWPFSLHPTVSSDGRSWSRALVVELPPEQPQEAWWRTSRLDYLPGPVVPLDAAGISQHDLAAFVSQPGAWDTARRQRLRHLFSRILTRQHPLLIYHVRGALEETGTPSVICIPVILLTADSVFTSPVYVPVELPTAQP